MLIAEIRKMPTRDRIILMEQIWDTLYHDENEINSPTWHEKVLNERRKTIENGQAEFISIDELKTGQK